MRNPTFAPASEEAAPSAVGVATGPVSGLLDALGEAVDAVVEVERVMASLAAVRSRLVADAVHIAGVAEAATGTREARRRDLAFRSVRAELATATRWSERAAERLMQTSIELTDECPATLAALTAGAISYRHAELVVEQARTIDDRVARAEFDAVAAELATALNPARFSRRVRELRERMHPEAVETRHRRAIDGRCVRLEPAADGMAWLSAFLPAVEAFAIHDRLTRIAHVLREDTVDGGSEHRDVEQLRTDLFRDLLLDAPIDEREEARGIDIGRFRGIRPTVVVTVPAMTLLCRSPQGSSDAEPPTLEGYGPIDEATARALTANAPSLFRLLTHPHSGARLDLGREQYRIPPDLRMWLRVRDATCRFPGCGRAASACDLDHTEDWAGGGESRCDNLASLCRTHHMLKHHSPWAMRQHGDGVITWTSPLGREYSTQPSHRLATDRVPRTRAPDTRAPDTRAAHARA